MFKNRELRAFACIPRLGVSAVCAHEIFTRPPLKPLGAVRALALWVYEFVATTGVASGVRRHEQ